MRFTRERFTIRDSLVAVAILAVALATVRGPMPPPSVLRAASSMAPPKRWATK